MAQEEKFIKGMSSYSNVWSLVVCAVSLLIILAGDNITIQLVQLKNVTNDAKIIIQTIISNKAVEMGIVKEAKMLSLLSVAIIREF